MYCRWVSAAKASNRLNFDPRFDQQQLDQSENRGVEQNVQDGKKS